MLERGRAGHGASRGNTGWVCPSFTYPLPAPGHHRPGLAGLIAGGGPARHPPEPRSRRSCAGCWRSAAARRGRAGNAGWRAFVAPERAHARALRRLRRGGRRVRDAPLRPAARRPHERDGLASYAAMFGRCGHVGFDGRDRRARARRGGASSSRRSIPPDRRRRPRWSTATCAREPDSRPRCVPRRRAAWRFARGCRSAG